ncbi:MAG: hypothetical protein AAFS08_04445 [Pseudomonadota bacterium]
MTRLVIHIGSEKTGSTAIQAFLFRNHQTLHKHGVNYLRKGRRAHAHNRILQARRSETLSEIMSEIVEEIQSKPDHTHVLTSELYFRPDIASDIAEHLPDDVRQRTKVLAYIRRQDKFLEAIYKQRLKNGRFLGTAQEFVNSRTKLGYYDRVISAFASTFGQDALIVRPFDRVHFPDGNVVLDAAHYFGVGDVPNLVLPTHSTNPTLSLEVSQLLGLLVKTTEVNAPEVIRQLARTMPEGALRSDDCFKRSERLAILNKYQEHNQDLCAKYCPELPELFDRQDLLADAPDRPSSSKEKLRRMERAQQIVFHALDEIRHSA